jgi:hypothetical protein
MGALLDRLAQARGPDVALDREIAKAVRHGGGDVPRWTGSIDAVRDHLMPEDSYWTAEYSEEAYGAAAVFQPGGLLSRGAAHTLPLALCIAALRAPRVAD